MTTARKVLSIAAGQIGYSRWEDPEQGTRYGRWYAQKTGTPWFGANGVPYCNMFTSWVLNQAGVKEPGAGMFAYVPYAINAYTQNGQRVRFDQARPGDLMCFDFTGSGVAGHIGFYEANRGGGTFSTIEGNTTSGTYGSQANGGVVARRVRHRLSVIAVLRPAYEKTATPGPIASAVECDGYWGQATTRLAQATYGTPIDGVVSSQPYSLATYCPGLTTGWELVPDNGAEGSQLVAILQKAFGATPDGIMGPETIRAMQKFYSTPVDGRIDAPSQLVATFQDRLNKYARRIGVIQ